tara:strand:+ start:451 stop:804 length:354 start_codon:yes stop_codon:yes gene_type:complete
MKISILIETPRGLGIDKMIKCNEENCEKKAEFGDNTGDYCSKHWVVKYPRQTIRVNQRRRNSSLRVLKTPTYFRGPRCICTPRGPDPDCGCVSRNGVLGLILGIDIREMVENRNAYY